MQKCCYRYSLKSGALFVGIFFSVNSLFHLFVGFFFFISKTQFYQEDIPKGLSAGSVALGAVLLLANIALIEGVIKGCRRRLVLWEVLHSAVLPAYAAAAAALCATLLGKVHFQTLRRLCPQVIATLLALLIVHGATQLQKKWKNIRDCYTRELNKRKASKSGSPAETHKKYVYFDMLNFLSPVTATKPPELEEADAHTDEANNSDVQDGVASNSHKRQKMTDEEKLFQVLAANIKKKTQQWPKQMTLTKIFYYHY